MGTVTTTLVGHETKSGTNAKGTWVMNLFEDQNGAKYQTFEADIASQALSLLIGQRVDITFEEVQRGDFTNKIIQSIQASTQIPTEQPTSASPQIEPVDRNAGIARAIETFGVAGVDPLENQDALFELADVYATYGALGVKPKTASAVPTV